VLALAGLAIAFVPGLPERPLDPELILFALLPPVLYADAFDTSWVDFRRWLRPILMLAIGLVAVTILAVGLVAKWMLPELPWAACFVLGAIVSPTDTVAVQAVIERLRIPRRATAILGGESLINDATGLVGVQLGVALVLTGAFEVGAVLGRFALVAGGGVAVGAACGWLFAALNGRIRGTKELFALSLAAPFAAFGLANSLGASGVLAVVVAGFVVAWRIHVLPPEARVDLYSTWDLLVELLNGVCFVFIGLETPRLVRETAIADSGELLLAGFAVGLAVIVVRFAWMFPAAYLPLLLAPRVREHEGGYPSWRGIVLAGWCGVRGVVSLAAALSLPATLPDGSPFPGRTAILGCTVCVILMTLFLQGSTLHPLIRVLGLREDGCTEDETRTAREAVLRAGIARLDEFCSEVSCPVSVHRWREQLADELATMLHEDREERERAAARLAVSREVRLAVAEAQSRELLRLRDAGSIDDNAYIALQLDLDRELRALARG
jgi:CPA1 family monovalent cation:H+ antiporter